MMRIIILSVLLFIGIGSIDKDIMETYTVLVDGNHGFDRVINSSNAQFNPNRFNISIQDKVSWVNNDPTEDILTIISEQNLFNETLEYSGDDYNYIFNNTGEYIFYIKEYPEYEKQIIVVLDNNKSDIINKTENFSIDNIYFTDKNKENENENIYTELITPLNIFKNVKRTGMIIFAIVIFILIFKD